LKLEELVIARKKHSHLFSKGHTLILGHTGSAKTSFLERIAQKKYELGHKILFFDLTGEST
jgi:type IV secretory pathway VirB4 component